MRKKRKNRLGKGKGILNHSFSNFVLANGSSGILSNGRVQFHEPGTGTEILHFLNRLPDDMHAAGRHPQPF